MTRLLDLLGGQEIQFEGSTHIAMIPEDLASAIQAAEKLEHLADLWEELAADMRHSSSLGLAHEVIVLNASAAELRAIIGAKA